MKPTTDKTKVTQLQQSLMSLYELKDLGHRLLDEYISLDTYRGPKAERKHAYKKLAIKLGREEYLAHFGKMSERKEVEEAISKLRKMIRKRKDKLKWLGVDKTQYADTNVVKQELEKIKKKRSLTT